MEPPPEYDRENQCLGCESDRTPSSYLCPLCAEIFPDDLVKAVCDPFTYAARLRSGELVVFHYASFTRRGRWVTLKGISLIEPKMGLNTDYDHPMNLDRGVMVRIDDIVWVADAPWGS